MSGGLLDAFVMFGAITGVLLAWILRTYQPVIRRLGLSKTHLTLCFPWRTVNIPWTDVRPLGPTSILLKTWAGPMRVRLTSVQIRHVSEYLD